MKRILVIRLSALGDALLTTPVLRVLREAHPAAWIEYLTAMPAVAELLRTDPHLDRCTLVPADVYGWVARQEPFDAVLDLFGSHATRMITRLSGAAVRVGAAECVEEGEANPYTAPVRAEPPPHDIIEHYMRYARVLRVGPLRVRRPGLALEEADKARALELLPAGNWAALQPGCRAVKLTWGAERFAEIGEWLAQELGARIAVFQGPFDRDDAAAEVAERLARRFAGERVPRAVLLRDLPVRVYAAALKRASVLVATEGAAGHFAAALAVRAVVLMSPPTTPYWFPYELTDGMMYVRDEPERRAETREVVHCIREVIQRVER